MKSNSDKDSRVFPLWWTLYYLIIISPHSEFNDFCNEAKESRTRATAETRNPCNLPDLTVMSKCDIIPPWQDEVNILGFFSLFFFFILYKTDFYLTMKIWSSSAFRMFFSFLSCPVPSSPPWAWLTSCVSPVSNQSGSTWHPGFCWKYSACSSCLLLGVLGELGLCFSGFTLNWVYDGAVDLLPALGLNC